MIEEQKIIDIEANGLKDKARELYDAGYRLVQISCTRLDCFELQYSFDKEYSFLSLRVRVPLEESRLESISGIYQNAFIYENEINDLFGVKVEGMSVDYKGNFYRTKIKTPFNLPKQDEQKQEG